MSRRELAQRMIVPSPHRLVVLERVGGRRVSRVDVVVVGRKGIVRLLGRREMHTVPCRRIERIESVSDGFAVCSTGMSSYGGGDCRKPGEKNKERGG